MPKKRVNIYEAVSSGKRTKTVRKVAKRIHLGAKKHAKKEGVSHSEGIEYTMKKKSTWRGASKYI
jgi:ribosome-binding ATPase YchF (GTP1/OBG family)